MDTLNDSSKNSAIGRLLDWFSLKRNVTTMIATVLVLTMGNQIWVRYIPKYLEYFGASTIIIGFYGSIKRLISALYQYPGGVITDKMGSKKALILFSVTSISGYIIYYISKSWELFIVGTFFVLVWDSMSQPAIFALIGETLPKSKRAMGFSVQSILKRIPIILAPPMGGYMIQTFGIEQGIKIGFIVSIVMAMLAVIIQRNFYTRSEKEDRSEEISIFQLWKIMATNLKHLLISDILARVAIAVVDVYIVLYVINILDASPLQYGLMISIQMTTSILCYIPAAKLADTYGRKPFVTATFLFFALFPLTLVILPNVSFLPLAFIVSGLREIGEPARKALIVDLADDRHRGKTIGLYYMIRGALNIPAPIIGGLLWSISPQTPFYLSFVLGIIGVIIFIRSKIG